jgi:DNA-binding MarR family transcriptional regulator
MDDDMHRLSNELVCSAARLVRDVRRRNVDLPAASTRLMSLLDELGPSTVGRLAEHDRCSQPTMTGLVNGLVDRGLGAALPHPDDSRAHLVSLTALGRTTLATLRRHNADLVAERIARLRALGRRPPRPPSRCSRGASHRPRKELR